MVGSGSLATLCSSYTHTDSALHVMVNRLARAGDSATLTGRTIYIKYKHIFRITLSVHTNLSPSCICYFITVADSSPEFIYFISTSYTTYSTHLFHRGMARSMSLCSRTGQDDHHLGGQTTYQMDFTTNQLVRLLGAHSCSVFTLPLTSWLDCSLHGLHRHLCWGLTSYA